MLLTKLKTVVIYHINNIYAEYRILLQIMVTDKCTSYVKKILSTLSYKNMAVAKEKFIFCTETAMVSK